MGLSNKKRARRNDLRTYSPIARAFYRERKPGEELPAMVDRQGGPRPGNQRCGVLGLLRGDCDQPAHRGFIYCWYHEKLRAGFMEPSAEIYPVWPLPANGYVLLNNERTVAA